MTACLCDFDIAPSILVLESSRMSEFGAECVSTSGPAILVLEMDCAE